MLHTMTLNPTDVLCGKGPLSFHHPGNVRYREIVLNSTSAYTAAKNSHERCLVVQSVVESVTLTGGRFVRERSGGASLNDPWEEMPMDESIRKVSRAIRDAASYKRGQRQKMIISSQSLQGMVDLQLSAQPSPINASYPIDLAFTDSDSEDNSTQRMLKSQFSHISKSRSSPLCPIIHGSSMSSHTESKFTDYRAQKGLLYRSNQECTNDAYLQTNGTKISFSREVLEDSEPNNMENRAGTFSGSSFQKPSALNKNKTEQETNVGEQEILDPPPYQIDNKNEDGNNSDDDTAFLALVDDTLGPLSPEEIVEHNLALGFDFSYLF